MRAGTPYREPLRRPARLAEVSDFTFRGFLTGAASVPRQVSAPQRHG